VIQEEGLYVSNMHSIVEKHFSISIPTRAKPRQIASALIKHNIKIKDDSSHGGLIPKRSLLANPGMDDTIKVNKKVQN
jgi:hypothetical protein